MNLFPSPFRSAARLLLCGVLAVTSLLLGCESTDGEAEARRKEAIQRIYYGQHMLLSASVLRDEGLFEQDLRGASDLSLLETVAPFAATYAWEAVSVDWITDPESGREICLFTYPPPTAAPLCYAAIAYFGDEGHRFFTLERAPEADEDGPPVMMGEWVTAGNHVNRGPRAYTDPQAFVREVFAILEESPPVEASEGKE